jgi:hypothetical protein
MIQLFNVSKAGASKCKSDNAGYNLIPKQCFIQPLIIPS